MDGDLDSVNVYLRFKGKPPIYAEWTGAWLADKSDADLWKILEVKTQGCVRKPSGLSSPPTIANPFRVVYNSGLTIRDEGELATLCVFYDHVSLPYFDQRGSLTLVGTSDDGKQVRVEEQRNDISEWEEQHRTLFEEGILSRIPPPPDYYEEARVESEEVLLHKPTSLCTMKFLRDEVWSSYNEVLLPRSMRSNCWDRIWPDDQVLETGERMVTLYGIGYMGEIVHHDCNVRYTKVLRSWRSETAPRKVRLDVVPSLLDLHVDKVGSGNARFIREDLVRHLLRTDVDLPQIFATLNGRTAREVFVALEAKETFHYFLPKLHVFHPVQILDLRSKINNTREGFSMHLQKLSKGLEERAGANASVEEIAGFARSLIETELVPDYREFQRQLAALSAKKWDRFLDAAGKIVEIDAAPWTPKFWGLLLRALGITIVTSAAGQEEMLSNKYQAFKFISELEAAKCRYAV